MTNEEYLQVQETVMACAGIIRLLDIRGFLARIDRCEAVAPIVDPTLYKEGMCSLEKIKRHAEGALAFQRAIRGCVEVVEGGKETIPNPQSAR